MNKIKKIILRFGFISISSLPIVTSVACSGAEEEMLTKKSSELFVDGNEVIFKELYNTLKYDENTYVRVSEDKIIRLKDHIDKSKISKEEEETNFKFLEQQFQKNGKTTYKIVEIENQEGKTESEIVNENLIKFNNMNNNVVKIFLFNKTKYIILM